ncbi:NnrS family protein [Colwellia sp. BRX10-4]|uniref:NnrS family protein n=1 Tax=Colwellia sp. BRX10-4 TaxID=2759843 RepID=UPI0021752A76|nr:NnrS family protein [Colwellia sp. BRX10-4]
MLIYKGTVSFSPYGGGYWWHIHEMIFGFGSAIIVGFLLTAVQNWTGIASVKGKPLAALFFLWLLGRVVIF